MFSQFVQTWVMDEPSNTNLEPTHKQLDTLCRKKEIWQAY
jgi:hypothetical protein